MFQGAEHNIANNSCYWPNNRNEEIPQSLPKDQILDFMLLAQAKTVDNFACTCLEPCSDKTIELTIMRSPATFDLNQAAKITQGDSYKRQSGCVKPYDENKLRALAAPVGVVLLKAEGIREEAVVYTKMIAVADVYNAIGLFFGLCILTVYETFEETIQSLFLGNEDALPQAANKLLGSDCQEIDNSRLLKYWYSFAVNLEKFRYFIGHPLSGIERSGMALVRLTTIWMLLWIILAVITVQQVCLLFVFS